VLDRFIQQALLQVLQPRFDPTFSDASYGFRPGRSAHDAVLRKPMCRKAAALSWTSTWRSSSIGSTTTS
jgi:retron-type reverse transcriptase